MSRRKRTRNLNSLRKLSRQIEAILTDNKKAYYVEQHIEEIPEVVLKRMTEVKFYKICETFYRTTGDITTILNFIEALAPLGTINIEETKKIAQKILYTTGFRPTRREILVYMKLEGMSTRAIARQAKCSLQTVNEFYKEYLKDKTFIKVHLKEDELTEILRFVGLFEKLQIMKF